MTLYRYTDGVIFTVSFCPGCFPLFPCCKVSVYVNSVYTVGTLPLSLVNILYCHKTVGVNEINCPVYFNYIFKKKYFLVQYSQCLYLVSFKTGN